MYHRLFNPVRNRLLNPRLATALLAGRLGLLGLLLAGCSSGVRAPVVDLSAGTPSVSVAPVLAEFTEPPRTADQPPATLAEGHAATYVVQPGDTLYSIARTTGASLDVLIGSNDIDDPDVLRIGQVLKLSADDTPPVLAVAPPPLQTSPVTPPIIPPVVTTAPPSITAPPAPPRAADAGLNNWGWPTSGTLIQAFTPATKGIDIAGKLGDPVQAAADGKVAYVGNGVRGLGNLILIEHAGGFLSAYAHNQRIFVTKDQAVKRGAKISEIGQTDTSSPRLHFEVRRDGTPVNPLHYLPPR